MEINDFDNKTLSEITNVYDGYNLLFAVANTCFEDGAAFLLLEKDNQLYTVIDYTDLDGNFEFNISMLAPIDMQVLSDRVKDFKYGRLNGAISHYLGIAVEPELVDIISISELVGVQPLNLPTGKVFSWRLNCV